MADEVGMSLDEYREQIIHACYLDHDDPIAKRTSIYTILDRITSHLDSLEIQTIHMH